MSDLLVVEVDKLRHLSAMWRETAKIFDLGPKNGPEAMTYRDCAEDLDAMIRGDFSCIELIAPNPSPEEG